MDGERVIYLTFENSHSNNHQAQGRAHRSNKVSEISFPEPGSFDSVGKLPDRSIVVRGIGYSQKICSGSY